MAQCVLIDAVKRKEINITRMCTAGAGGPGEAAGGNGVVGGSNSGGGGGGGGFLAALVARRDGHGRRRRHPHDVQLQRAPIHHPAEA
jgi:hypothetical protein